MVGAGLVMAGSLWRGAGDVAYAAPPASIAGQELIAFSTSVDDHREQITVVDPRARVVSVYHVARDTGEISLKSVRNIHWDLQMEEFNSANPQPREVRVALEQR
jgi:hypothetical protein